MIKRNFNKLICLADKLEKLRKYAAEVDSTAVTLLVRPIINNIFQTDAPKLMITIVSPVLQKKGSGKAILGGKFILNATLMGGMWKVNAATSKIVSPSSGDAEVDAAIEKVSSILTAKINRALETEFNKKKELLAGDTITNHETDINTQDMEI